MQAEKTEGLRMLLRKIAAVPDEEWTFLEPHLCEKTYAKGIDLIRIGDPARHFWYILEGILRFFYITEDGKEFNKAFSRPGEIAGPLVSWSTQKPCGFAIQAVTDAEVLAIPTDLLSTLFERHPCWERVGRLLAQEAAVRKELREQEFLLEDAHSRYQAFRERYPGLEDTIPQKHIASYIGITEVALSRILNRG